MKVSASCLAAIALWGLVAVVTGVCGASGAAEPECSGSVPCSTGICSPDGVCVECVANADCTGATAPICDTTANTCEGCNAHADCTTSHACDFATGACIDKAMIAYVAAGGT